MTGHFSLLLVASLVLTACAEDQPPARPVNEFVENPILLEAAIVRCSRDRPETRYDQECMNAREAVKLIEARQEHDRRAELEARSEAKRQSLRRLQEAQEEAQRLAEENRRRHEEAEYLAQFGVSPPAEDQSEGEELPEGNVPLAVVPEAETIYSQALPGEPPSPDESSNAPVVESAPPDEDTP